jgi:hypothetical protein
VSAGAVAACSCFAHADASNNAVTLKNKTLRFIGSPRCFPRFRLRFPGGGKTTGRMGLTSVRAPRSEATARPNFRPVSTCCAYLRVSHAEKL